MTRVHPAGIYEGPIGKGVKRYQLEADYQQGGRRADLSLRRPVPVVADDR